MKHACAPLTAVNAVVEGVAVAAAPTAPTAAKSAAFQEGL